MQTSSGSRFGSILCACVAASGACSESSDSDTPVTAPLEAPEGLSGSAPDSHSVALSWIDASTSESGFDVERAEDVGGAPGAFAVVMSLPANATAALDDPLPDSTTSWYRVVAVRGSTRSEASAEVAVRTLPAPPSDLLGLPLSPESVRLRWIDNSSDEAGFQIERADDVGGAPGTFGIVGQVAAGATQFDDLGLAPTSTHWYRVSATRDGQASEPSGAVAATTFHALYSRGYGAFVEESFADLVATNTGLVAVGRVRSFVPARTDAWLVGLTLDGDLRWQRKLLSGTAPGSMRAVEALDAANSGDVIAVGDFVPPGGSATQLGSIARLDDTGALVWSRRYDSPTADVATCVVVESGGASAVGGTSAGSGGGLSTAWVARFDAAGATLASRSYSASGVALTVRALASRASGGLFLAGSASPSAGFLGSSGWIAALAPDGNVSWAARLTAGFNAVVAFHGLAPLPDGSVIAVGEVDPTSWFQQEALVVRYSAAGVVDAARRVRVPFVGQVTARRVVALAGDELVLALTGWNVVGEDSYPRFDALVRLDAGFTALWARRYGGIDSDTLFGVRAFREGSFAAWGQESSWSLNGSAASDLDGWLVVAGADGRCNELGVLIATNVDTPGVTELPLALSVANGVAPSALSTEVVDTAAIVHVISR